MRRVLVLNTGSSSGKWTVLPADKTVIANQRTSCRYPLQSVNRPTRKPRDLPLRTETFWPWIFSSSKPPLGGDKGYFSEGMIEHLLAHDIEPHIALDRGTLRAHSRVRSNGLRRHSTCSWRQDQAPGSGVILVPVPAFAT